MHKAVHCMQILRATGPFEACKHPNWLTKPNETLEGSGVFGGSVSVKGRHSQDRGLPKAMSEPQWRNSGRRSRKSWKDMLELQLVWP